MSTSNHRKGDPIADAKDWVFSNYIKQYEQRQIEFRGHTPTCNCDYCDAARRVLKLEGAE